VAVRFVEDALHLAAQKRLSKMSDYATRSKEYQAQEEASRKRQAAEAKAGSKISKQKDAEYSATEKAKRKELDAAQTAVQNRMKSYGGGRYQQPRRALGILSDAKRLLRI
jgi:hypothetical protein